MKHLGRRQLMRSLTWCGVLSWLGSVSPNKSRWLNVWLVHPFEPVQVGSALCPSVHPPSRLCHLSQAHGRPECSVLKRSTFPLRPALSRRPGQLVRGLPRLACESLPERRPLNLFASVSSAQQVRNEPTAAPPGWEVKPKVEEGWNTGKSFTHIKITHGHSASSPVYLSARQFMWKTAGIMSS